MAHFDVYTISKCAYCTAAKGWMIQNGHTYTEHNIQTDPSAADSLREKVSDVKTVPQIFLADYHIGGYDDLMMANRDGSLKILLEPV